MSTKISKFMSSFFYTSAFITLFCSVMLIGESYKIILVILLAAFFGFLGMVFEFEMFKDHSED